MYSSFQSYTPFKRLSSLLSKYLEFDENQLQLGHWSGDLQLQNVTIKKDALEPILNAWKQSKAPDFLDLEQTAWSDAVRVTLVQGTIGALRIKVPWQKLLIGSSDAIIDLSISDITIVLRIDAEPMSPTNYDNLQDALRSTIIASMLHDSSTDGHHQDRFTRAMKQQIIQEALSYHSQRRDVPHHHRVVPSDLTSRLFDHPRDGVDEETHTVKNPYSSSGETEPPIKPTATWTDRLMRSLASSFAWRIAKALHATVRNVHLVLIQDDVETGITHQLLEIKDAPPTQQDHTWYSDTDSHTSSHPSADIPSASTRTTDTTTVHTTSADELRTDSLHSVHTTKVMRLIGLGLFIRKAVSPRSPIKKDSIHPDDYILRPTDMSLRCNFSQHSNIVPPPKDIDSDAKNNDVESVSSEKVRRGKRDKRRRVSVDYIHNFPGMEDYNTILDMEPSLQDTDTSVSPTIQEEYLPSNISVDVAIPSISLICATHHYELGHAFASSLARTRNGRPVHTPSGAVGQKGTTAKATLKMSPSKQMHLFYRSTIRSWWKYAIVNVLRDLRSKKLLAAIQEKPPFAQSSILSYAALYRREYVALYINLKLKKHAVVITPDEDENTLERVLLFLEDILQVEQILLFRSMALKITRNETSILRTCVFGKVDRSVITLSSSWIPTIVHYLDKYPSVTTGPSVMGDGMSIRLKRPVDAQSIEPFSLRLKSTILLSQVSFMLVCPTGAHSLNHGSQWETDSNDDMSALTMGSFEDSSSPNYAGELTGARVEHVPSDGRMILFGQHHQLLLCATSHELRSVFVHHPGKRNISVTIRALECRHGEGELLSFQPLRTKHGERDSKGILECNIGRVAGGKFCDATLINSAIGRLMISIETPWLLKIRQFLRGKGTATFPSPTVPLSALELLYLHNIQICLYKRRLKRRVIYSIIWQGLDCRILSQLSSKDTFDRRYGDGRPFSRLALHLALRQVVVKSGGKSILNEAKFIMYRYSNDAKMRLAQLLYELSRDYGYHACVSVTGLSQHVVTSNISMDEKLDIIDPVDVTLFFSSDGRLADTQVPSERLSLIFSSLALKCCPWRMQTMYLVCKTVMNAFVSSDASKLNERGDRISSTKFRHGRERFIGAHLMIAQISITVEKEDKENLQSAHNICVEDTIQDILLNYLSNILCFHEASSNGESTEWAKRMCVDYISALGLSREDAVNLTKSAKDNLLEEMDLMEKSWNAQKKILIELAAESSKFSYDTPRDSLKHVSDSDNFHTMSTLGHRRSRSQSYSDLSSFISPRDEPIETLNDYESNFLILEQTMVLSVQRAMKSHDFVYRSPASGLVLVFPDGLIISHAVLADGGYECSAGIINLSTNGSPIFHMTKILLSSKDDMASLTANKRNVLAVNNVEMFFSSVFAIDLINILTPFYDIFGRREKDSSASSMKQDMEVTQVNIHELSLLLYTDDQFPQPFSKISFSSLAIDSVTDPTFSLQKHLTVISASSKLLYCIDLSPQGSGFPSIVKSTNQNQSFDFRLNISNNPSILPFEAIVSLYHLRVFLCRRFVNEILQYFNTQDYGIGRVLQFFKSQQKDLDPQSTDHLPLKFEVRLIDCSLILPKDSTSLDGLVALRSKAVTVFKTLHVDKWKAPHVYSFDHSVVSTDGINEKIPSYHDDIIQRTNVVISDLEIYVGTENPCHVMAPKLTATYTLHIRDIIQHDALIFDETMSTTSSRSDIPLILLTRKWQKVTPNPFELKLMIEYAPHLRICVMDSSNLYDVSFDMKMSQFYALLSLWYSNMQELPMMFPYSNDCIQAGATYAGIPANWPEYDSAQFVQRVQLTNVAPKVEMAFSFKRLDFACSFDHPNHFQEPIRCEHMLDSERKGILFQALDLVVLFMYEQDGLIRVSCGATNVSLIDNREKKSEFSKDFGLKVNSDHSYDKQVDVTWGLHLSNETRSETQYLPFCASVFMTPDRWCQINLGMEQLDVSTSDLAPVWMTLEYFGDYFRHQAFGHPFFVFEEKRKRKTSAILSSSKPSHRLIKNQESDEDECLNIDFRLHAIRPHFAIPSNHSDLTEPFLVLESDVFFYRYRNVGYFFSTQDIRFKLLDVTILRDYSSPSLNRAMRDFSGSDTGIRTLIDGLNSVISYSYHTKTKHTNLRVSISADDATRDVPPAEPESLEPSYICRSVVPVDREYEYEFSRIRLSVESFKLALPLLMEFLGPYDKSKIHQADRGAYESFVICLRLSGLELLVCDDGLGMHLPFYSISIPLMTSNISQIPKSDTTEFKLNMNQSDGDLQIMTEVRLWIDYFKLSPTRSFEPFLEPYHCLILYEKSLVRGKGIKIVSECPFHMNATSASLESIDTIAANFHKSWKILLQPTDATRLAPKTIANNHSSAATLIKSYNVENVRGGMEIIHVYGDCAAVEGVPPFLFRNYCGFRVRFSQRSTAPKLLIQYLDHGDSALLQMPATKSIVKNLKVNEIPFLSKTRSERSKKIVVTNHTLDLQIPGFMWIKLPLDTIGRCFVNLTPKSTVVNTKLQDWRIKNVLKLLTDIRIVDGGRQIKVFSPFEVINRTQHKIQIAVHANPMRNLPAMKDTLLRGSVDNKAKLDDFIYEDLCPEDTYHIPFYLLESALHLQGTHIGSFWLRPNADDNIIQTMLRGSGSDTKNFQKYIGFCSAPLQLARIVQESSSLLIQNQYGDGGMTSFDTNMDISCPIMTDRAMTSSHFCYCMEIRRGLEDHPFSDPQIFPSENDRVDVSDSFDSSFFKTARPIDSDSSRGNVNTHGPVAYSLVLHPPITIENLLPERGRFELMHATRRQVLWFGDLAPGESVPIHTIRLDAPLLLLMNLGYCRTPFGQGILVHPGNSPFPTHNHSQPFEGKHVLQITKLLSPSNEKKENLNSRKNSELGLGNNRDLQRHLDTNDEDKFPFSEDDLETEAIVVDSLGQKLTLNVNNDLGSGGQRRITIWCPFWILNTTEHALLYKQERASTFVSGTVHGCTLDGSRQVDGSLRQRDGKHGEVDTVFPGRPGILATSPGNCTLQPEQIAGLLDEQLSLKEVSAAAFMFNFHEKLAIGQQRLCIQLKDTSGMTRYTSGWSEGFSLESVGVSQVIGVHCADGRQLEVTVKISIPSGSLGKYTKIVRFSPRYLVVNHLLQPIRVWQDSSLLHPARQADRSKSEDESSAWHVDRGENADGVIYQYEPLFGGSIALDFRAGTKEKLKGRTSAHRSALYIASLGSNEVIPFHLPDTRQDREIRVDLGSRFNLTSSFPLDIIGADYVLKVTEVEDVRLIDHVNTRAAPTYSVQLPPTEDIDSWDGDLGLWLESIQWDGDRKIVVKGIKRGKYSYNSTDVRVGDELLSVNDVLVSDLAFTEVMKLIKENLYETYEAYKQRHTAEPLSRGTMRPKFLRRFDNVQMSTRINVNIACVTLTFNTLEHRMNELRRRGLRDRWSRGRRIDLKSSEDGSSTLISSKSRRRKAMIKVEKSEKRRSSNSMITASIKMFNQSICVFLQPFIDKATPYRIDNRSINYAVHFRQYRCEEHNWISLEPGESSMYCWDEPTKNLKLSVRIGNPIDVSGNTLLVKNDRNFWSSVKNEEHGAFGPTCVIELDEIGCEHFLQSPSSVSGGVGAVTNNLYCRVDTDGSTRVLIISEVKAFKDDVEELQQIERHLSTLSKRIDEENTKLLQLKYFHDLIMSGNAEVFLSQGFRGDEYNSSPLVIHNPRHTDNMNPLSNETLLQFEGKLRDMSVFSSDDSSINRTNQLLIEVLEAKGLPAWDSNQLLSPYSVVKFIKYIPKEGRKWGRARQSVKRSTYYVKKSLTPKWSGQVFVFDVPDKAVSSTHGYSIVVKVKDFSSTGYGLTIGFTEIHLSSLKNEKELFGWHPLISKASKGTDFLTLSDGAVRGSILLRLQWIHTTTALLDYYLLSSQRRVHELESYSEGMKNHATKVREALKNKQRFRDLHTLADLPNITQKMISGRRDIISPKSIEDKERKERNWATNLSQTMRAVRFHHIWSRTILSDMVKYHEAAVSSQSKAEEHSDDQNVGNKSKMEGISTRDTFDTSSQRYILENEHASSPSNEYVMKSWNNTGSTQKGIRARAQTLIATPYNNGSNSKPPFSASLLGTRFHHRHSNILTSMSHVISINDMRSWMEAMVFLNDPVFAPHLSVKKTKTGQVSTNKSIPIDLPFPWLAYPHRAPAHWQSLNYQYLYSLHKSRATFNETSQKTLMTMLSPGGILKLRPITVHNVPDSFTGMYVKVKYGDGTMRTRTVNANATPKWSDDFLDHPGPLTDNVHGHYFNEEAFDRKENDLEVHVQPLKIIGSLRVSVVGVKANSKVEIGVLLIPLSYAIEATFDRSLITDSPKRTYAYVRWFPLKNPKDFLPHEGDFGLIANTETERTDPNFEHHYTPTIKMALWWEPFPLKNGDLQNYADDQDSESSIAEMYFQLSLNSVSVSLIDSIRAKELAALYARDINLRYSSTKSSSRLNFMIGLIQVDNQDESAVVPVVFAPTPTKNPQPTVYLLAIKDNLRSKSMIHSFKLIALAIEELDVRFEEGWMIDVCDFFIQLLKRRSSTKGFSNGESSDVRNITDYAPIKNVFTSDNRGKPAITFFKTQETNDMVSTVKKVYIEKLMLGSLKVNVSYMKTVSSNRSWTDYGKSQDFYNNSHVAHTLPNTFLSIIPSITNAPITVGGKVIDNVFEVWDEIVISLQNYYVKEVLHQVYKVVGSLDFVGNPTMLLNSFMKGARDFVVQPLREFLRSPDRIGIGVAKGTLSLVSHFFAGVSGFLTNISIAGGNAAAALSLDERFQRWHKKQLEDHARHVHSRYRRSGLSFMVSAISRPMQDIFLGMLFATTSVFVEPYYGAKMRGKVGFVSGIAIGALGIVTKPIVGLFDAFAHASETVHDAARLLNVEEKKITVRVRRLRLPYIFGVANILLPYHHVDNRAMNILHNYVQLKAKGEYEPQQYDTRHEALIVSEVLHDTAGVDTYVLVTTLRIAVFRVKSGGSNPQVQWMIELSSEYEIISTLEDQGSRGVILRIAPQKRLSGIRRNDSLFSIQEELSDMDLSVIVESDGSINASEEDKAIPDSIQNKNEIKWPLKSYKLLGESDERPQLTNVHNAICCISRNYSSIIIDGARKAEKGNPQYVHFKNMVFESNSKYCESQDVPSVDLDQLLWLDEDRDRDKWTLADEEKLSRKLGGPEWLVKTRARNAFTPTPLSLPAEDPTVVSISKKVRRGLISLKEAQEEISALAIVPKSSNEDDTSDVTSPSFQSSTAAGRWAMVPFKTNDM